MNAKHQFKYTYSDTELEEFSPVEVTFDMPGDVTITQMLYNFESYLKACGFYFDGHLEIVDDTLKNLDLIDELDGTLYEFEDEPQGGCMADFDKECGCSGAVGAKGEEGVAGNSCDGSCEGACESYKDQKLKEWSEGLAKLEQEIKEERDIREKASDRADELKEMNERWNKLNHDQKMKIYEESIKESEDKYPIEPLYKKVGTLNKLSDSDNCWNS